jgi:hypothetical protein
LSSKSFSVTVIFTGFRIETVAIGNVIHYKMLKSFSPESVLCATLTPYIAVALNSLLRLKCILRHCLSVAGVGHQFN